MALTPGEYYKFRVRARNSVGYGLYSSEIEILAAHKPDPPINLTPNEA